MYYLILKYLCFIFNQTTVALCWSSLLNIEVCTCQPQTPSPSLFESFFRLLTILVSEWLRLLPFLGVLALLGYLAVRPFLPKKKQQKDSLINLKIQKENPKVVNEINIEDLCLTKAAYCRCWRSKTVRCPFTHTLKFCAVNMVLLLKSPVLRFCEMREFSIVFSTENLL